MYHVQLVFKYKTVHKSQNFFEAVLLRFFRKTLGCKHHQVIIYSTNNKKNPLWLRQRCFSCFWVNFFPLLSVPFLFSIFLSEYVIICIKYLDEKIFFSKECQLHAKNYNSGFVFTTFILQSENKLIRGTVLYLTITVINKHYSKKLVEKTHSNKEWNILRSSAVVLVIIHFFK